MSDKQPMTWVICKGCGCLINIGLDEGLGWAWGTPGAPISYYCSVCTMDGMEKPLTFA